MSEWVTVVPSNKRRAPWRTCCFKNDASDFVAIEKKTKSKNRFYVCFNDEESELGKIICGPFPSMDAAKIAYMMLPQELSK